MKVTNEKIENSQAFLSIEMEPQEVEESLSHAYQELVKKTKVPGFRVGKAPRAVLERHIGKENLFDEALHHLLPRAYEQALKEQNIEAIAQPEVEIAQMEPVVFKVKVPLKPKVALGSYQDIQVEEPQITIADSDVDGIMEQFRHQRATWEPVERAVEFADLVVLDIESNIDGQPFINEKSTQYQVLRDLSFPVTGFSGQLVGMKRDEEKEFKLQFPADDTRSELAGKESSFKVKIIEIKREILPELNDEFAKEVNQEHPTVDSLREWAASQLKLRAEEQAGIEFRERVIDVVIDRAELEFPPVIVDAEINQILNQRFTGGKPELESYLKQVNKSIEELVEELRPAASKRVSRSLVLAKIAEEEKVDVTDPDIDGEIETIIKSAAQSKEELEKILNTLSARESLKQTLITRKTVERLVELAKNSKKVQAT